MQHLQALTPSELARSHSARYLRWAAITADIIGSVVSLVLPVYNAPLYESGQAPWIELSDAVRSGLALAWLMSLLTAYVGLFRCWGWARYLYVGTWIASVVLGVFEGPAMHTSVGIAMHALVGFTGGFLVCVIFFTSARDDYERRSA